MVDVVAGTDSQLLLIDMKRMKSGEALPETERTVRTNLLMILAEKNLKLSRKIRTTSARTIRGKLTCFLNDESILARSEEFDLPFDRQALADYLNCDRSQLSKELSKMQSENLIRVKGNHITILSKMW